MQDSVIHWFRQDLRLSDNPALCMAVKSGKVLPLYILDDENSGKFKMGAASRCWLHHSLHDLNASLSGQLFVYKGKTETILPKIIKKYQIKSIFWNRCYEPWRINCDKELKAKLLKMGLTIQTFNGSLLWEPWDVLKDDSSPYKVFTPYFRKCCQHGKTPRQPLAKPSHLQLCEAKNETSIKTLNLLPTIRWDKKLQTHWQISEQAANKTLHSFLNQGLDNYKDGRNFPAKRHTSRLSPYLHFGQVSPNQVWYALKASDDTKDSEHFCSELGWREFSYSLLYHYPTLPEKNLQQKFDSFPWGHNKQALKKWQRGQTGYPIVDAGMRELWQTGYMHNRVRMIVASFLVKNLNIHWQHGERWFWDCLFDADLANNSASWQWVAGSGADAAPFFRIFNPLTQAEKFDPNGDYIRHFVPELKHLPKPYLFAPFKAPDHILSECKVKLGETYPSPIVDLKQSRLVALEAFQSL